MEYLNYILLALIFFYLVQRFLPAKGVKQISTTDLKKELKNKSKQFIDVRTPAEYKTNHIQGFKNIPLNQLTQKANELSTDKEIVLICQTGMRSNKASKTLYKLGFKKITNVKGGLKNW